MKLNELLTDYFCSFNNIDINTEYKIERINARALIIPERIDLIAKLKYIECREKGYDLSFAKELYAAHIHAFTYGSYDEPGDNNKKSIDTYYTVFNELIDSIRLNGVDERISAIPAGKNNVILNGSHRVAIAAYFNQSVPVIRFENLTLKYDTEYFKKRMLDEIYIDYLVTEYCKLSKNIYFACIWPKASGKKNRAITEKLINDLGKVVYKKDIKLSLEGLFNLIIQIYSQGDWIGGSYNNYDGGRNKAIDCFDNKENLTVYIFECDDFDKVQNMKESIRNIFKIGNHSIHITDNNEETVQITNLLLNSNSVNSLNNGNPSPKFKTWCRVKIRFFRNLIIRTGLLVLEKLHLFDVVRKIYLHIKTDI